MRKRLFVGNLVFTVTDRDLKERFARFGDVDNVELHTKKDEFGKPLKMFAYVDLNIDQEKLVNCIKTYNSAKWKGSSIVVQVAKESYIQRIQREAKIRASQDKKSTPHDSAEPAPLKSIKQEKSDWMDGVHVKTEKPDWTEGLRVKVEDEPDWPARQMWQSDQRTSRGPPSRGQQQATPEEFAEKKAFLFDDEEGPGGSGMPLPQCRADVALLRHAWGHRLGVGYEDAYSGNDLEVVVPANRDPEQEREAKRQAANAKRLASLKERFAQSHTQQRLVQSALSSVNDMDRKRRIVFEDTDEEEAGTKTAPVKQPRSAGGTKLALFDDEEAEEEENSDLQDFRLRPQFEGHRGHKVLELQSRFAADDRFRLSERFLESDDEEFSGGTRDGDHSASMGGPEPMDPEKERTRNLDILRDVLGLEGALSRPKPIFKDAMQLRFDPAKDSAAKFEIKPEPKQKTKKKKMQEEAAVAAVPQVSGKQFYEVTGSLHDALTSSRSGSFSLAQMFAGRLQDEDLQAEPFDGASGSSGSEASEQEQAEYHSRVREVSHKKLAPQEFFRTDASASDAGGDVLLAVAPKEPADDEGEMSEVFKRMDDHRFAAVVDRPRFFFVTNDRRLLEGAKFFRCQSDPETIRNNFFDGKTALVKLMLSKRKMAKRALERKHGKKLGSQQWRLGKLRKM